MSEAPDDLIETPAEGDAPPPELTVEDRARAMGWKDDPEGLGDRFVDAETFVKRGEEILPILQASNRKMEKALDSARKDVDKLTKTLERFAVHHDATEQRVYERARAEIQAEIRSAASVGDVAGVEAATGKLEELNTQAKAETPTTADVVGDKEAFEAWQGANPWFGKEKAATAAVQAIAAEVQAEGFNGKAFIEEVDKRARKELPHKFTNPNRNLPGAVEGGGRTTIKTGKTYSDLPAEAKAACDDFVKRVPGFTRERYIKDYFA